MKKGTKIGLGITAILFGSLVLTGCTNSFCSTLDKAHIMYAIDYGVSQYFDTKDEAVAAKEKLRSEGHPAVVGKLEKYEVYYAASIDSCPGLDAIWTKAQKSGIPTPSVAYYIAFDTIVLERAIAEEKPEKVDAAYIIGDGKDDKGVLIRQGYLKFYGTNDKKSKRLWENWDEINNEVRLSGTVMIEDATEPTRVPIDECSTKDFTSYYKNQIKSRIASYRSCLATEGGFYGNYGDKGLRVQIEEKNWSYAWQEVGFLSGLLVYPIGWLIDKFTVGFGGAGQGWAQLLAILFVTIIVRSLMLLATFKQTTASSKMQELQPEIAKIQAKYPNSNTNQYEKQRVAQETQALYKKHKINPFTSIIVMIVQFPIFICVWGAMQGSAQLSSGAVLGLNLSTSISSVLTTWSNWANPASGVWTALVLFLLMAGAQTVAMLLPQWLAKAKKKKIAKLGRNPAQKDADNKTKWFTYIMLAMIIFMGFSLVSALGVYWLVGALFSIAQTLITHAVMNRKKKK